MFNFFSRIFSKTMRLRKLIPIVLAMTLFFFFIQVSDDYGINTEHFENLANLNNFKFFLNNKKFCFEKGKIDIIFVVPSHPEHFHRRKELRTIYNRQIMGIRMSVVFFMGRLFNTNLTEKIQTEFLEFKDVIQGNFNDTYRSVAYNHLQGLKWANLYCSQAAYIVKTDDDIYVNIFKLVLALYKKENIIDNKIFCYLYKNAYVVRDAKHKYYVPKEEFAADVYPTYCNGWLVVYPQKVAKKIVSTAAITPFLWMSDVFITGIVSKITNTTFMDMAGSYTFGHQDLVSWSAKATDVPSFYAGPGNERLMEFHNKSDNFYSFKRI